MTIDLLSSLIEELILTCDQVCLPGLGCFTAQLVPASISDRGYTINPPYRKLSFSEQIPQQDDNSIAQLYSQKYSVEFARACREVESAADQIMAELSHSQSVNFKNLGKLRSTGSGRLFFVSDIDLDIYPEGFGLQSVSMKNREFSFMAPVQQELNGEPQILVNPVATESAAESSNTRPIESSNTEDSQVPEKTDTPEKAEAPEKADTPDKTDAPKKKHKALKIILFTLLFLLLLTVAAFFVAKEFFPEVLDRILYSAEELELLNKLK